MEYLHILRNNSFSSLLDWSGLILYEQVDKLDEKKCHVRLLAFLLTSNAGWMIEVEHLQQFQISSCCGGILSLVFGTSRKTHGNDDSEQWISMG